MKALGARSGAALPIAILLTTAATLLAHGILVMAARERAAARAAERVARLELLAAAASRRAADRIAGRAQAPGSSLEVVGADSAGGVAWEAGLRRLSAEVWLAEGRARQGRARRAVAEPVWRLDPDTRIDALGAVATVAAGAAVVGADRVEAVDFHGPQAVEPPDPCAVESDAPAVPSLGFYTDSSAPALGRLDLELLVASAPLAVAGSGTPEPVERFGACLDTPWNWGDPRSLRCGGRIAHVAMAPDVRVEGGSGQGLLVGRGDVSLVDARLWGLVVADGVVRLIGTTTLTGMVLARGGIEVGSEARVLGSRCWAAAALGLGSLAVPRPIEGSGRIRLHR